MREILVVNPRGKTRKKKTTKKATKKAPKKSKKGVKTMARKKRVTKKRTTAPKKRRKTNPSKAMRRRAASARRTIGGMNIKSALKNVPASVIGMMSAKWAAKRFGGDMNALETDPESWTAMDYVKGGIGAFAAGFVGQMVKPGMGQKILEGGLSLMGYKLLQNELIPRSEWATSQFGAEETAEIQYDEEGTPYLLGEGGWMPVDERHRLPEEGGMYGDELTPPGPLGDELTPPGELGDAWEDAYFGYDASGRKADDPFAKAFFGG